ncbi:hypothetical protein FO519_003188 [Halicephalobus sp. NKZ332]|nr:hypothetical protein FO519_003188 [Halicephalobus sp. NKZ332]
MTFVLVKEYEDSDECVKLPLEHNRLTLITLKETFTESAGLLYRSGSELNAVGLLSGDDILKEPFFKEPESGWANKTFFVKRGSRSPTHAEYEQGEKQKKYIERLSKFMFYSILTKTEAGSFENVGNIRSCVTVAEKEYALMAAHCLPIGVPEQLQFEIYNQDDEPHVVQIKYINRQLDFAVLKTVDKEFDAFPTSLSYPDMGTKYTVLGYHGYNCQVSHCLSAFVGRIRNNRHSSRLEFVLGSPGTTRGCSGAGAFTHSALIGIVVAGRVSPQNVYSNNGSLSDHVAEACTELAEPSYSHIVPSSTIFALFDVYNNLHT